MILTIWSIFTLLLIQFDSFSCNWLYSRSNALCYGEGKAYRCVPKFTNIIEGLLPDNDVHTCGKTRKQRICADQGNCHSCMRYTHDVRYLTDAHVNNNMTYWASGDIKPGESLTISYSFKKLFEVYYISLIFLPLLEPDSVEIEKSSDNGLTWSTWQYFSKDCQRSFGLPASTSIGYYSDSSPAKTSCAPLTGSGAPHNNIVAAFSTTGSGIYSVTSKKLLKWMSATNIRITLNKFKTSEHHLGFTYPPLLKKYFGRYEQNETGLNNKKLNINKMTKEREIPSLLNAYDYFAIADISVGGRCQCYGHAGRCLKDEKTKSYYCDCQHNTAGRDCEKCQDGYIDIPWAPATLKSAAECKRCNCNLHSKQCRFDQKLYILSNEISGGTCEKCEHNTAGRYCHYCDKGYYRDWSKPLSHQFVCLKCRCHPIGSKVEGLCDQRNSQCICKPGVTGLSCNRCKKGYQQTTSPATPCIKSYDPHKIPMAQPPENNCQQCNNKRKRIRFKKYCRKDAVLLVTMQSREQHNEMVRFEMKVNYVWRLNKIKFRRLQPDFLAAMNAIQQTQTLKTPSGTPYSNTHSTFPLWLRRSDLECGCPSLQLGVLYLVILKLNTIKYLGRAELFLDQKSVALRWQKNWIRRLQKFSTKELKGHCDKFKKRYRRRRKRRQQDDNAYHPY